MRQAVNAWANIVHRLFYMPVNKPCHGGKNVYVSGDYVEVWCVSCATNVPRIHRRHNNVLGIRVFVTSCSETFIVLVVSSLLYRRQYWVVT